MRRPASQPLNNKVQPPTTPLSPRFSPRESIIVAIAAITIVILVVYSQTLNFDFVTWDDNIHVYDNPYFRQFDLGHILHFWRYPYQGLYIPISYTVFGLLAFAAQRQPGTLQLSTVSLQLNPEIFHLASLALHIFNAALVFLLLRRWTKQDLPAAFGALVFAVHPLQVESVAWISELRGLLEAALTLVSIHLYMDYASRREKKQTIAYRTDYALCLLTAACAMLAKPSAVTIGLLLIAVGVFACGKSWKTAIMEALPVGAIGAALVLVTAKVQAAPPGQVVAIWTRPFVAGEALWFYLTKFIAPFNLTIDYGQTPTSVLSHWWVYVVWIVPCAMAAGAAIVRKRRPYIAFGLALTFVSLLPVLGLTPFVFQKISTTADRYCYLALLGAGIVTSFGLASLKGDKRKIAIGSLAAWLIVLAGLSYNQARYWQNSETLFTHAVAINPQSAVSQNDLGAVYKNQQKFNLALNHYLIAARLDPTSVLFRDNVGVAYSELGENSLAESEFRGAIAQSPRDVDALCDLGKLLLQEGRISEGTADLKNAIQIAPDYYLAAEDLGDFYANSGDYRSAAAIFTEAVRSRPDIEPLWRNLGASLYALNKPTEAVTAVENAVRIDPTDQSAQELLNLCSRALTTK